MNCKFTVGFEYKSQKGSHIKYVKKGKTSKTAIIPNHDTVARGTHPADFLANY